MEKFYKHDLCARNRFNSDMNAGLIALDRSLIKVNLSSPESGTDDAEVMFV